MVDIPGRIEMMQDIAARVTAACLVLRQSWIDAQDALETFGLAVGGVRRPAPNNDAGHCSARHRGMPILTR
jgi:hypothetical protein